VSLGVTVVNALMTFPPIYLIEVRPSHSRFVRTDILPKRIGRRSLITISIVGALLSLISVGYGIDGGHTILASVAIIAFVA
jgi:hypothetical protein